MRTGLASLWVAFLVATPVGADWLVMHDGSALETRGRWRTEGKLVIFELPTGRLSSLQLAEVDMESSEAATRAEKLNLGSPPETAAGQAVLVLTDADVRHPYMALDSPPSTQPDSPAPRGQSSKEDSLTPLVVDHWRQRPDSSVGGVVISGELANPSTALAADIRLTIDLFDTEGRLLESLPAALALTSLLPGLRTTFRAQAPGTYSFSYLHFEITSRKLETRSLQ